MNVATTTSQHNQLPQKGSTQTTVLPGCDVQRNRF